jgi:hypothetical protein
MLEDIIGEGLIIHHWDTDGICSATLLLNQIEQPLDNITPSIGAFYLSNEEVEKAKKYDFVIIVDMALPENNIKKIAEKTRVIIFDHHHQNPIKQVEHINPVAIGNNPRDYPSCTWVLKKTLELPLTLYVILGLVGDREQKILQDSRFKSIMDKYTEKEQLSFEILIELVKLLDSNYKVGDKDGVEEAPLLLQKYESHKEILSNHDWIEKKGRYEAKIEEVLKEPPYEENGILIKELKTEYSLISSVTRRIAWGTGKDTIVVNKGFFPQHDQIYCRSQIKDMKPMISIFKVYGYNAGGKTDVLGAIVPKKKTEKLVSELKRYILKK